jgi:calcineurin-like phosphoesterase family protein
MMKTFFTSDTHYGHGNIIRYCCRPFGSTADMNDTMVLAHNAVVDPEDRVIHVGDFAFGNAEYVKMIAGRLNGTFMLIIGNHDRKTNALKEIGWDVCQSRTIEIEGVRIFLHHRPVYDPTKWPVGTSYHFHGHSHNRIGHQHADRRIQDVGVDRWGFVPRTWEEIVT